MKKNYKIVLVIGNGFDLDLGLKTGYVDFMKSDYFKAYLQEIIPYKGEKRKIKDNLFKYLEKERALLNWIDIETELLNLATREVKESIENTNEYRKRKIRANSDIEDTFECLHDSLCSYLESLDYNAINKDSTALKVLKSIIKHHFSQIISYNYTDIKKVENLVGKIFCPIDHVHGRISDKSIILGFQDNVEIDKSFCFMIKSFNQHFKSHNVRKQLLDADEIIFFGHSLGCTDYHYFEDLFKYQSQSDKANEKLIMRIFTYDERSRREILFQLREMNEKRSDMIYELCDFKIYRTIDNIDNEKIDKYLKELDKRIAKAKPVSMGVKIGTF